MAAAAMEPTPAAPVFKLKEFADIPAKVSTRMVRSVRSVPLSWFTILKYVGHVQEPRGEENSIPSAPASPSSKANILFLKKKAEAPIELPARFVRPEVLPKKPSVPRATETLATVRCRPHVSLL
jgi:hypothetical protein